MLIFHKILPIFFLPIGLGILVLFVGALFRKWVFVWLGIVLLWVLSMPVTGEWLMRQWCLGECFGRFPVFDTENGVKQSTGSKVVWKCFRQEKRQ